MTGSNDLCVTHTLEPLVVVLMGELLGMLLEGKPATWQNRGKLQRKQSDKPKRGEFGDGWHCGISVDPV
eukprot:905293-Amphidinium_carterae.1